jgi:hypothetical protein
MLHMKNDDIPLAARADAFDCDCGCGIITIRLLDNGDEPMAEIVFEPGEWLNFFCRLQKLLVH